MYQRRGGALTGQTASHGRTARHDSRVSVPAAIAVVVLTLAAVWLVGSALARSAGPAIRILAGALSMVGVGWVGMLVSTLGVAVLGQRTVLRIAVPLALIALIAIRRPDLRLARPRLAAIAAIAVAAVILWPSVSAPSNLGRGADAGWHSGWTHQLMSGATTPGGPYGGIPAAYPWLFHALAAWIAQVVPGSLTGAFLAIQVLALLALGAGTWLLASELGLVAAATGWATVLVLGGAGVGWIWQHSPAAVLTLRFGLGAYHGDFILPTAMSTGLGSLAPLLPREAALALLPGMLWLAVRASSQRSMRLALLAGGVAGFAVVLGPVEGGLGLASVAAIAIATRFWGLFVALPAALLTASVWLVPLALSSHSLGGLRETTTQVAPDPTVAQAAVALGMLLPLGAAGLILLARRHELRPELIAIIAVAVLACGAGIVAGSGHVVFGTHAIVHWLRYVPVLAIALVLPAGYAAAELVKAAGRRAVPLGIVLAAIIAVAAMGSTALASAAIRAEPPNPSLVCTHPLGLTSADDVAVSAGQVWITGEVGFGIFSASGARILWLPDRLARIPFKRLPAGVSTEHTRRTELSAIAAGAPPPAGVTWVVTNRPPEALARDLHPYSWCVWRGTVPLRAYRVVPSG